MSKFSVTRGVGNAYEAIYNNDDTHVMIDDKKVYRETKTSERTYYTDVEKIFKTALNVSEASIKELEEFNSFVGIIDLMNKYLSKKEVEGTCIRYFNKLWGLGSQALEKTPTEDYDLKIAGWEYFDKKLGTIDKVEFIKNYYNMFESYKIKSVFHKSLKNKEKEFK